MKLIEKFKQWLDTNPRNEIRDIQLEQIADDYAIEFAEWIINNCDEFPKDDQKLLLEKFKKEKQL